MTRLWLVFGLVFVGGVILLSMFMWALPSLFLGGVPKDATSVYAGGFGRGEVAGFFRVVLDLEFVDVYGEALWGVDVLVFPGSSFSYGYLGFDRESLFKEVFSPFPRVSVEVEVPAVFLGFVRRVGESKPLYKDFNLHVVAVKRVGGGWLFGEEVVRVDPAVDLRDVYVFELTITMVSAAGLSSYGDLDSCVDDPPYYEEEFLYGYVPIARYSVDIGISGWVEISFNSRVDVEGRYRYLFYDVDMGCWRLFQGGVWLTTVSSVYMDRGISTVRYSGVKTVEISMKTLFKHYIWQLVGGQWAIEEVYPVDTSNDPLGPPHYNVVNGMLRPQSNDYVDTLPGETSYIPLGDSSGWSFTFGLGLGLAYGPISISLGTAYNKWGEPIYLAVSSGYSEERGLYLRTYSYGNTRFQKSYTIWFWYGPW